MYTEIKEQNKTVLKKIHKHSSFIHKQNNSDKICKKFAQTLFIYTNKIMPCIKHVEQTCIKAGDKGGYTLFKVEKETP